MTRAFGATAGGASYYIDASGQDCRAELQKLGGASVILATAPERGRPISLLVDGLSPDGKLLVPGRRPPNHSRSMCSP